MHALLWEAYHQMFWECVDQFVLRWSVPQRHSFLAASLSLGQLYRGLEQHYLVGALESGGQGNILSGL